MLRVCALNSFHGLIFYIPLDPPFPKGDFKNPSLQFPPLTEGGRGDFGFEGRCHNGENFWHSLLMPR